MVDWSSAPKPKKGEVIDHTGIPMNELLEEMFYDLMLRENSMSGALLLNDDNRPMYVDPILNIAHDPYKWKSQGRKKK